MSFDSPAWNVKLYAEPSSHIELDAVVPVFHKWIQEKRIADVMIDVADYAHVHQGPGVLLVCHGIHYALEQSEGRLGLLYARKMTAPAGTFEATLKTSLAAAVAAAKILESEPTLAKKLVFKRDELRITLFDRLRAPNTKATHAALTPEIRKVLPAELAPTGEPRDAFGLRATGAVVAKLWE